MGGGTQLAGIEDTNAMNTAAGSMVDVLQTEFLLHRSAIYPFQSRAAFPYRKLGAVHYPTE